MKTKRAYKASTELTGVVDDPAHEYANDGTANGAELEHTEDREAIVAQPSFNSELQKFQYTTNATTSATVQATATQTSKILRRSVRHTSSKRALKDNDSEDDASSPAQISSPAKKKKKRKASGYADPSKYAHLKPLTDILEPNLICIFVGTNPGVKTATAGHAYAHPSNLFWKLLHSSGCTDRRLKPEEDVDLPRLYCMGNTNIVSRPTKDAAELSKEEQAAGTAILEEKFRRYKPEAVCIVGKMIWESIWRHRYGRNPKPSEFKYGWQDEKENMGKTEGEEVDGEGKPWKGARVFVTTSTSGLSASTKPAEKEAIWKPFGEWVQQRREERDFTPRDR